MLSILYHLQKVRGYFVLDLEVLAALRDGEFESLKSKDLISKAKCFSLNDSCNEVWAANNLEICFDYDFREA